jgi:hypothetical protein
MRFPVEFSVDVRPFSSVEGNNSIELNSYLFTWKLNSAEAN